MISEIVGDIINSIDKTIKVKSLVQTVTEANLYYCGDIKWLELGDFLINSSGEIGEVLEITDTFIRVSKTSGFVWTNFNPEIQTQIHYLYGSRTSTNAEWLTKAINEDDKLPLVFLALPALESNKGRSEGLDRESEILIYFIDTCFGITAATEIIQSVIKRIWKYFEAFLAAIQKNYDFAELDGYKSRELYFFGKETYDGFETFIDDSALSAVEIQMTLPIRRGAQICNC